MEQEFEETLNSDMMRRIYFLLDMSLLRRESRASHIENLNCAIARCWAASYRPNMSFGFKLYDSELGEYALQALLRGVAAELQLPQRLHGATGSDLSSNDLPYLLMLVDKATDDEFLQTRGLGRERRSSRNVEFPATGLSRALQTAISSSYLQKLAETSTSGEIEAQGNLVLVTPSVASDAAAKMFVGADALQAAGSLTSAMGQLLPAKLQAAGKGLNLHCTWFTTDAAGTDHAALKNLAEVMRCMCTTSLACSLATAAASPMTREAFASLMSIGVAQEADSRSLTESPIDECWPEEGMTAVEEVKAMVAMLESMHAPGEMVGRGRRILRAGKRCRRTSPSAGAPGEGGMVSEIVRSGRGLKLAEKALKQATGGSRLAGIKDNTAKLTSKQMGLQQPAAEPASTPAPSASLDGTTAANNEPPMELDGAIERLATGVATIVDAMSTQGNDVPGPSAGAAIASTVQSLVATAFTSVLAHEALSQHDDGSMDVEDLRIALFARATIPATEFKDKHRAGVARPNVPSFAWQAAVQVLLRLGIAAYGTKGTPSAKLPAPVFQEVEALMQMVVATMSPIPSGGQRFFKDVIQTGFGGVLRGDIRRLEAALWDDEESEIDPDGTLAAVRARHASMEVSGETPEPPTLYNGNQKQEKQHDVADAGVHKYSKAPAATKVNGVQRQQAKGHRGTQQRPTASLGPSNSMRSLDGEGSGINATTTSGATAATTGTRRNNLLHAEFLKGRYNMSTKVREVRVHAHGAIAKQASLAGPSGGSRKGVPAQGMGTSQLHSNGQSRRQEPPLHQRRVSRRTAVPETPDDAKKKNPTALERKDNILSPKRNRGLPAFSSPVQIGKKLEGMLQLGDLPREDVVPNTSPRPDRSGTMHGDTAGVLRQPLFDLVGSTQVPPRRTEEAGHDMEVPGRGHTGPTTWFATAIIPKGNKGPTALPTQLVALQQSLPDLGGDDAAAEPNQPEVPEVHDEKEHHEMRAVQTVAEDDQLHVWDDAGAEEAIKAMDGNAASASYDAKRVFESVRNELGCSRCKKAANGCNKCRPSAATALISAGAGVILAAMGCTAKACHPGSFCAKCWTATMRRLTDEATLTTATDEAAAPADPVAKEDRTPHEVVVHDTARQARKRIREATTQEAAGKEAKRRPARGAARVTATKDQEQEEEAQVTVPTHTASGVPLTAERDPPAPESLQAFEQIMAADVILDGGNAAGPIQAALETPIPSPEAPSPPVLAPEAVPPTAVDPKDAVRLQALKAPGSILGKRSLLAMSGRTPGSGGARHGRLQGMLLSGGKPRPKSASRAVLHPLESPSRPPRPAVFIADVMSPNKPSPYADDWALPTSTSPAGVKKKQKKDHRVVAPGSNMRDGKKQSVISKGPTDVGAVPDGLQRSRARKLDLNQNTDHRRGNIVVNGRSALPVLPPTEEGESVGDAPPPSIPRENRSLPRLGSLSPVEAGAMESDEEDAAILEAAAKGKLSPLGAGEDPMPESPRGLAHKGKKTITGKKYTAVIGTASALEATPQKANGSKRADLDPSASTPQSRRTLPGELQANRSDNECEGEDAAPTKRVAQRHMTQIAAVNRKGRKAGATTKKYNAKSKRRKDSQSGSPATAVAVAPKAEGVPKVGDDVRCMLAFGKARMEVHLRVVKVVGVEVPNSGTWECTVEGEHVMDACEAQAGMVKAMTVKLRLEDKRPWSNDDDALGEVGLWRHLQASPQNPTTRGQKPLPPAETLRHNAAARQQGRDSADSMPVLPSKAERLRAAKQITYDGSGGVSPAAGRKFVPKQLALALEAVQEGGVGRLQVSRNSTPRISLSPQQRRDVMNSAGWEAKILSPQAQAAAAALLGQLYVAGTSPLEPASVRKQLDQTKDCMSPGEPGLSVYSPLCLGGSPLSLGATAKQVRAAA